MANYSLSACFNECVNSLQMRVIETQAKILLHSSDCNKYSYFFDNDCSESIKHPCLLGYKNWTEKMVVNYLNDQSQKCTFCMPRIDYKVVQYWECGVQPFPPEIQYVKQRIEKHWNIVRHLAQEVQNHSKECNRFRKDNGEFGCLEILNENFCRWEDGELKKFYEPKTDCNF